MELILKASAAALTAVVTGILIKKSNPELSTLLSACTVAVVLFTAVGISDGLRDLVDTVKKISGSSQIYIAPIMKCLGIALVTKISSDLCKDSSHAAAASALDVTGAVCALVVVMPLIMNLLKMIGGLA